MSKIQFNEKKTIKLQNILIYRLDLEDEKHFHYYLCHQLKCGGMEIIMKKSSKIVIGILFFVLMIVALFIVNHYFLNGLPIGLQAIVSGLIATVFMCIYMFCIWRK